MPRFGMRAAFALALATVFVASACGGDDDDDGASDDGGGGSSGVVSALDDWTYEVEFLNPDGTPIEGVTWESFPVDEITEEWEICAAIVHLKDPYWLALDYGLAQEAARTGTKFNLLAAGGYTELSTQLDQLDDCVAQGADGIIIGATSADGVVAKVEEIVNQGIPVVGIGVPVFSDDVPVAFASFRQQGRKVGEFMLDQIGEPSTSDPVRVAFFPGPEGAGWPDDSLKGFEETVEGKGVEIVAVEYGDTGKEVQLQLIEDVLQAEPDIDYIVGNAVAATVAPQAIDESGRDIQVISTYITYDTYQAVKNGDNLGTVSDSTALTGRLGYDILIRILEGEDFLGENPSKDVGPVPFTVSPDTLTQFEDERDFSIPPDGFEPVFTVN
ncbi:MAG: TMAO reductase system periplasmic protein TorT [Acidimicrobiia bacterium]|nr:TMAO reductase system periplasmic protein TorT [Acidimicrobiia bacterium]